MTPDDCKAEPEGLRRCGSVRRAWRQQERSPLTESQDYGRVK
jgi:hypothetical protein